MYKSVKIQPYNYVGIDGKSTTVSYNEDIGVGKFENEDSNTYTLICKISKDIGNSEEQEAYATLISTLLNENRKYSVK